MRAWKRTLAAALTSGALLAGTCATPTSAAPDGRVSVAVGLDTVLKNATIKRATERVAKLCGGRAADYTAKARKADSTGSYVFVCTSKDSKQVSIRP